MLHSIAEEFPNVFSSKGTNRPHSQGYREFAEKWGFVKTLYEVADEKIDKIGEIYQIHINDFLQYMSYMVDKFEAERQEDEFQEMRRKAKKGRH